MVQFSDFVNINFNNCPALEKIYNICNDSITASSIHIAVTASSFLNMYVGENVVWYLLELTFLHI